MTAEGTVSLADQTTAELNTDVSTITEIVTDFKTSVVPLVNVATANLMTTEDLVTTYGQTTSAFNTDVAAETEIVTNFERTVEPASDVLSTNLVTTTSEKITEVLTKTQVATDLKTTATPATDIAATILISIEATTEVTNEVPTTKPEITTAESSTFIASTNQVTTDSETNTLDPTTQAATTVVSDLATTSGPLAVTTFTSDLATTSDPQVTSTVASDLATTSAPQAATTVASDLATTSDPQVTSTVAPDLATTSAPQAATTVASDLATTSAPQVTSTVAPDLATTSAPQAATTVASDLATTSAPQVTSTVAPDLATTSAPQAATTVASDLATTSDPQVTSTVAPDLATTSAPQAATTVASDLATTSAPQVTSTVAPDLATTSAPQAATTVASDLATTSDPQVTSTVASDLATTSVPQAATLFTSDLTTTIVSDPPITTVVSTSKLPTTTLIPVAPPKAVIDGSSEIPLCGALYLYGLNSRNSIEGSLTYHWNVSSIGESTDLTNILNEINDRNNGNGHPVVRTDGHNLVETDVIYTFGLTVTNSAGLSGSTTKDVVRTSEATFEVATQSHVDVDNVRLADIINLASIVKFYSKCMTAEEVVYSWTCDAASIRGSSRILHIPAYTLPGDQLVECIVTVSVANDTSQQNSASVTFTTVKSDLVASIQGGDKLDVGVDNGQVTLDGSKSYDPDTGTRDNLVYAWSCNQVSNNAPCQSGDSTQFPTARSASSAILNFDANLMTVNQYYKFTLTVTKDTRSASTDVTIFAKPGAIPEIVLEVVGSSTKVSTSQIVSLKATISHTSSVSILWSTISASGYRTLDLTNSDTLHIPIQTASRGRNSVSFLTIEKNNLVRDARYQFLVKATTTSGQEGSATLTLDVYRGVENCQLVIPNYTVLDEVTYQVSGCTTQDGDDAYPFLYEVSLIIDAASTTEVFIEKTTSATGSFTGQSTWDGGTTNTFILKVLILTS
ncbi:uncharacterized protein [Amphiura filiformis]|uniref:uncharacterized protein n=1 Tax=Amphiura filiformis TaxID=82378 RepID=UPI003B20EEF2